MALEGMGGVGLCLGESMFDVLGCTLWLWIVFTCEVDHDGFVIG